MDNKEDIVNALNKNATVKTILVIKSRPRYEGSEEGVELNDGYEFEANGALPEIADGIAKFAKELENNGFGENSGKYFVNLVNQYFDKLNEK